VLRGRIVGAVLLCAVALAVVGCRSDNQDDATPEAGVDAPIATQSSGPLSGVSIPTTTPTSEPTPEPTTRATEPTPTPLPQPAEGAQLTRLVIPKAKVDHRLVTKGLTPRREMQDPGGKDDVAWYNFSTLPGFGSNAVLSGHVDWYTGERGVFWYLRDLQEGDEAQIHYSDGTVITYRVMRVEVYGANSAPVAEITGPTSIDQLTMITCDGVFQRSSGDYTDRRVVFAERVA
jgi:LPXTG-site transpeptidase (sortase) family protein